MPPDDVQPLTPAATLCSSGREFLITRRIEASPAALFRAWTTPREIAKWWGPAGYAVPVAKVDLRPGGACRLLLRAPDGTDYPFKGIYQEIVADERLVMRVDLHAHPGEWHELLDDYRRDYEGRLAPETLLSVSFRAQDGGALLDLRIGLGSKTECHALLKAGMGESWSQSLDRLAAHLTKGA